MATKIFPSVNDVNGGVAGQGKTLTEANIKTLQALPYFDRNYVKSGAVCTNGGGLNLSVAAGVYCIDGRWINKDASESVLLSASATNRVWLQLTKDGSGNVTGTTWNVQTGTTVPSDAVLVAVVVTGASTITTITASFRGIIAPGGDLVYSQITAGVSGATTTVWSSITLPPEGVTNVNIEAFADSVAPAASFSTGIQLYDSTAAANIGRQFATPPAGGAVAVRPEVRLAPWTTGSKVIQSRVFVGGGSTASIGASATEPGFMRATWAF
ncbi:MAG TPA: hypothetical protein VF156_15440 [Agromyces sp.]